MGSESGPEVSMDQAQIQGVVLVILDVNKDISTNALNWALGHVARKGDTLRLVGILSHVLNPSKFEVPETLFIIFLKHAIQEVTKQIAYLGPVLRKLPACLFISCRL